MRRGALCLVITPKATDFADNPRLTSSRRTNTNTHTVKRKRKHVTLMKVTETGDRKEAVVVAKSKHQYTQYTLNYFI
eukprot:m.346220 g.346220  ORF g.346220 m.346220 type:complete len:77 (-) comp16142_c1_seq1:13184-13414(-)